MRTYALPLTVFLLVFSPAASTFDRPIPAPHTATAELWFALASFLFCIALYAVHRVVKRR